MSASKYYEDLSGGDSSIGNYSDDSNDFDCCDDHLTARVPVAGHESLHSTKKRSKENESFIESAENRSINNPGNNLITDDERIILHLDIDCFYCQCECIDKGIDPDRPLAIGQKHIIVTCNYAARKQLGLTKLSSRQHAKESYPELLIVDGSDLERYRKYGRIVYECFRNTIKSLNSKCSVCKGSMDEMMADVTSLIEVENSTRAAFSENENNQHNDDDDVYIYGEQNEITLVTEDQSGATTKIIHNRENQHVSCAANRSDLSRTCLTLRRLQHVAKLALRIRQFILKETGFAVTLGLSVNPFLAKLGSGLRKPGKVNILPPTRSALLLIESMPLRKIPGVGSRTMKSLKNCLEVFHCDGDQFMTPDHVHRTVAPRVWTCGDLLRLPKASVQNCLRKVNSTNDLNVEEKCDNLLKKCRGIDASCVVDDEGNLSKTLSVEDSYRRGTVTKKHQIMALVDILYARLVRLIRDRMVSLAAKSCFEHPTLVKLTVRNSLASESITHKSTQLKSQQIPIDGMKLVNENDPLKQKLYLRDSITPLLHSLIFSLNRNFNITRMNIALSNFIVSMDSSVRTNNLNPCNVVQRQVAQSCSPNVKKNRNVQKGDNPKMNKVGSAAHQRQKSIISMCHNEMEYPSTTTTVNDCSKYDISLNPDEIDQEILSQLPPDIVAEVKRNVEVSQKREDKKKRIEGIHRPHKRLKTISDFFRPVVRKGS